MSRRRGLPRCGTGLWACVVLLATPASGLAAETCKKAEHQAADQALMLSAAERAAATAAVFPWGAPQATAPTTHEGPLVQRDYVIDYDDDLFGPVWSADVLGLQPLGGGRVNCFRADPRIPQQTSDPLDYNEAIFDQGHLVPNADMTFGRAAIINTFVMTNMSPQFCQFNRGVWQILESLARRWSERRGRIYVLSGAVFERDGDGVRDADAAAVRMHSRNGKLRVAVPSMYFKILASPRTDGGLDILTLLLPHEQTDLEGPPAREYLDAHVSNLAAVEALTDLRFFPDLAGARVETGHLWDTTGLSFDSLVTDDCRRTAGAVLSGDQPRRFVLPGP
jgi:endonuclease G, mitochondrial